MLYDMDCTIQSFVQRTANKTCTTVQLSLSVVFKHFDTAERENLTCDACDLVPDPFSTVPM